MATVSSAYSGIAQYLHLIQNRGAVGVIPHGFESHRRQVFWSIIEGLFLLRSPTLEDLFSIERLDGKRMENSINYLRRAIFSET